MLGWFGVEGCGACCPATPPDCTSCEQTTGTGTGTSPDAPQDMYARILIENIGIGVGTGSGTFDDCLPCECHPWAEYCLSPFRNCIWTQSGDLYDTWSWCGRRIEFQTLRVDGTTATLDIIEILDGVPSNQRFGRWTTNSFSCTEGIENTLTVVYRDFECTLPDTISVTMTRLSGCPQHCLPCDPAAIELQPEAKATLTIQGENTIICMQAPAAGDIQVTCDYDTETPWSYCPGVDPGNAIKDMFVGTDVLLYEADGYLIGSRHPSYPWTLVIIAKLGADDPALPLCNFVPVPDPTVPSDNFIVYAVYRFAGNPDDLDCGGDNTFYLYDNNLYWPDRPFCPDLPRFYPDTTIELYPYIGNRTNVTGLLTFSDTATVRFAPCIDSCCDFDTTIDLTIIGNGACYSHYSQVVVLTERSNTGTDADRNCWDYSGTLDCGDQISIEFCCDEDEFGTGTGTPSSCAGMSIAINSPCSNPDQLTCHILSCDCVPTPPTFLFACESPDVTGCQCCTPCCDGSISKHLNCEITYTGESGTTTSNVTLVFDHVGQDWCYNTPGDLLGCGNNVLEICLSCSGGGDCTLFGLAIFMDTDGFDPIMILDNPSCVCPPDGSLHLEFSCTNTLPASTNCKPCAGDSAGGTITVVITDIGP